MNWKACITVFASAAMISFPQNMIGCGPDADPWDYYTSFFQHDLSEAKGYRPFYYTGISFLYEESEPVQAADILAEEWAAYCGNHVRKEDAYTFVNKFSWANMNDLYNNIEKKQPKLVPDSIRQNAMAMHFIINKDFEALGYLMFAKKAEPFVAGGNDYWEPIQRDSLKMAKLIKNGQQLYVAAKKDIFKLKYGYQVVRLAHYSGRYEEAVKWYDEYIAPNTTNSVLQPLSLSLKAGALLRTGKEMEAAYLFSKCFNSSIAKRVSNFLGFKWSINPATPREDYLALCKNDAEKAALLSLFAMNGSGDELEALKKIHELDPASKELEVLVTREIHKLEEEYLTKTLDMEKGGKTFYYYWSEGDSTGIATAGEEAWKLAAFLHSAAQNKKTGNPALFETAAAYAAYMIKDYKGAGTYLELARTMKMNQQLKDQWTLTKLLVTINEQNKLDAKFEDELLPSIQWLEQKALAGKPTRSGYYEVDTWKTFYRDLMSQVLAKIYHRQGDLDKETLALGAADRIVNPANYAANYDYSNSVGFLRENLASKDVEKLYALLKNKQASKFEQYLISHNVISQDLVIDFAGTAYLREYDYDHAIDWFKKSTKNDISLVNTNPFVDLMYDQIEPLSSEAGFSTTKLAFALEMKKLSQLAVTDKKNTAKHYYKMALGMYNMTYYGHAWNLVNYYRSGSDGYHIPKDATAFEKEYYGCYSAHDYFEKALTASADNNFKARCLFMMAKCAQKQVRQPQYSDFNYQWDAYDKAGEGYFETFKQNRYFPLLKKEYGNTAFYKQAYNTCSYLRDFVKKR